MSRILSGLDSDFRRVITARVLSLLFEVDGGAAFSPAERIDEVAKLRTFNEFRITSVRSRENKAIFSLC